ncbi:beta-mannosidase [Silvibacterium bohemicum]|uniref:Beta-mannosidase n=1 Tax=Silvibacterium bohemicum TaxID=1577686 RepID=A0A841K1Y6_9BACT|nr:glycoside hydrolase family 2 protein [Silvibacterium bohemicum]MBB6144254.1 beta-mannosidase [Silvibacterium bohemicum]
MIVRALLLSLIVLHPGSRAVGELRHRERIPLERSWSFRQLAGDGMVESQGDHPPSMEGGWMTATVPGDVHLDLLKNGKVQDPFYRDNEATQQWIEKAGWEYRSSINATKDVLSREHIDLVFEGLDTACTIYLNGQRIASPDNMFREWRIDAKPLLHAGANELRIVFPAPMKAAEAVAEKDPWHSRTHTDPKGYIRKAVYEFGWDWGPRFATSGVYRPAYLEVWDDARVKDVFVQQEDVAPASAHLDIHTEVLAAKEIKALVSIDYGLKEEDQHTQRMITLAPGTNRISIPVELVHPQLWYPSGYGAQPIYRFHVSVKEDGQEVDAKDVKTGLRSVVLRRELDQWGRSFEFVVNGIPIFAKGADIIPFDSFPSRVTNEKYQRILQSARDANMNMVRLWGGGYYETQEFYDLCDELGLMVFHDLMFGNNWQPGTYQFKQEIEREAEFQITRLRNHPSIVLWDGNNETESLRDWNGNGQLPAPVHERIWEDYLTEFSGILARTEARLDPQTPYWPSTPSADYEELSDAYQSGDNHDWSIWHGNADFEEFEKRPWRFVSEYGFQSFPEMKTIESFTTPEDRASIFTPVMLAHQKNGGGNKIIEDYMTRYFGEPKNFASFLYASQVLQAEGIKVGAEAFRRARPRTMGSLFWQLNDCWPVASWSSIDYYGRWKALQYYARRFYAPVLVSPHLDGGTLSVYIVSDKTAPLDGTLRLRIMDFSGKIIKETNQPIRIEPLASKIYQQLPMVELSAGNPDWSRLVGEADLTVGGQKVSTNLVYFVPSKKIQLPAASITSSIQQAGDGFDVTLSSPVLARSTYLSFGQLDVDFSDNYIDLLPAEPRMIHVTSNATLSDLKAHMKIITLVDAFSPPIVGK